MEQFLNGAELYPGRELYHDEFGFEFQVLVKGPGPNRWWCAVPKNFKDGIDAPPNVSIISKMYRLQHRVILFDFSDADIGEQNV